MHDPRQLDLFPDFDGSKKSRSMRGMLDTLEAPFTNSDVRGAIWLAGKAPTDKQDKR